MCGIFPDQLDGDKQLKLQYGALMMQYTEKCQTLVKLQSILCMLTINMELALYILYN